MWGGRARVKSYNKRRILGPEWSMSEVGTPPPHNLEKPQRLVDIINNNNNLLFPDPSDKCAGCGMMVLFFYDMSIS